MYHIDYLVTHEIRQNSCRSGSHGHTLFEIEQIAGKCPRQGLRCASVTLARVRRQGKVSN